MLSTTTAPQLDGLAGLAVDVMDRLRATGAALAVAAENRFPPIPSEVILPVAGLAASRGDLELPAALVLGGYWLGERWHRLESVVGVGSKVVVALAVLALGWFVTARLRRVRGAAH